MSSRVWCDDPCRLKQRTKRLPYSSLHNNRKLLFESFQVVAEWSLRTERRKIEGQDQWYTVLIIVAFD